MSANALKVVSDLDPLVQGSLAVCLCFLLFVLFQVGRARKARSSGGLHGKHSHDEKNKSSGAAALKPKAKQACREGPRPRAAEIPPRSEAEHGPSDSHAVEATPDGALPKGPLHETQVSDRVAKMMAKKAERKARKAREARGEEEKTDLMGDASDAQVEHVRITDNAIIEVATEANVDHSPEEISAEVVTEVTVSETVTEAEHGKVTDTANIELAEESFSVEGPAEPTEVPDAFAETPDTSELPSTVVDRPAQQIPDPGGGFKYVDKVARKGRAEKRRKAQSKLLDRQTAQREEPETAVEVWETVATVVEPAAERAAEPVERVTESVVEDVVKNVETVVQTVTEGGGGAVSSREAKPMHREERGTQTKGQNTFNSARSATEREILKLQKKAREMEHLKQRQAEGEVLETLQLQKLERGADIGPRLADLRQQHAEEVAREAELALQREAMQAEEARQARENPPVPEEGWTGLDHAPSDRFLEKEGRKGSKGNGKSNGKGSKGKGRGKGAQDWKGKGRGKGSVPFNQGAGVGSCGSDASAWWLEDGPFADGRVPSVVPGSMRGPLQAQIQVGDMWMEMVDHGPTPGGAFCIGGPGPMWADTLVAPSGIPVQAEWNVPHAGFEMVGPSPDTDFGDSALGQGRWEVCWEWCQTGWCPRGITCRWEHPPLGPVDGNGFEFVNANTGYKFWLEDEDADMPGVSVEQPGAMDPIPPFPDSQATQLEPEFGTESATPALQDLN